MEKRRTARAEALEAVASACMATSVVREPQPLGPVEQLSTKAFDGLCLVHVCGFVLLFGTCPRPVANVEGRMSTVKSLCPK